MIHRISALLMIPVLIAVPVLAQNPTGRWNATIETQDGPLALVFEFEVEGGNLTGTVSADSAEPIPISEGMIMDGELTFTLRFEDPGAMTLYYHGIVVDDGIRLTSSFESGGPPLNTYTATRDPDPE